MKTYKQFLEESGEKKWQKYWEDNKSFVVTEEIGNDPSVKTQGREKFYGLVEFPYPSGAGLHVGHPRPFTAMDVICRKKRMEGKNVLFPMGFDAFGLPTENFAIKTGRPPAEVTAENIANFTRQLKMLGYSFDWSRMVDTTDPKYYKWTQWIFLQLFKHGLAYKKAMPINWCLSCKTGLANEEVVDGKCERCGGPVEKRNKEQWMLAITKYADKLLQGLETVDYIPQAKTQQQNWIGRSEGAEIKFKITSVGGGKDVRTTKDTKLRTTKMIDDSKSPLEGGVGGCSLEVFTTRPDTLFGATYMVLAPEHSAIQNLKSEISNYTEVEKYVESSRKKTDQERGDITKEKSGIELKGLKAINPANGEELPIFVADYVLGGYGTGAIMAVPAHDERDFEFAKKYNLPIRKVVKPEPLLYIPNNVENIAAGAPSSISLETDCFVRDGIAINSDFLNGLNTQGAKEKMITWLGEKGIGKRKVQFKLRDWVFSRQRYWGEPIPLVYCENCKDKKYHFVIIHGYTSYGYKNGIAADETDNWRKKIKIDLEVSGNTVFCPDLPNTNEPNIDEQVEYILKNTKIDENTILVGHSLGGVVIYKLLEKLGKKVAKVLLVDPVVSPEFPDRERPMVVKSCDWKFNFEKIKKLSKEFVVLGDANFKTILEKDLKNLAKLLNAGLVLDHPEGRHFTEYSEPSVERLLQNTGWIPLPESELPLELPKVEKYEPTDSGESPLAHIDEWVNIKCPVCGGKARRETDTMPNWAGSSWYFLRYCDAHNDKEFASADKLKYWMAVDWYNGGMEHTVLHLLYSRFWNQFLYDIGVVPTFEAYKKRTSHGMILAEDGEKMSKSRGNVINPDEMVEKFGTDAFRTYIMFMGPFDQAVAWNTNGVIGMRRFLEKVWALQERLRTEDGGRRSDEKSKIDTLVHQTIKKVTDDIEAMRFNTAISQLMILVNEMSKLEVVSPKSYVICLQLLSPFAPHLCEELWSSFAKATDDNADLEKYTKSISLQPWPKYDPELAKSDTFTLAVQINGKLRDTLELASDISEEDVKKQVLVLESVKKWLEGKEPKKVIYVKGKLVSIVV